MMRYWVYIIFMLGISFTFSQQLNLNLDKEEVQIGEPFTLSFSVISKKKLDSIVYLKKENIFPGKSTVNSDSGKISTLVYDLEISRAFKDTIYQEGKEFIWKGSYQVIAWDSAYVVIPPELIYIEDSLYLFPAGLIHVLSPKVNPTQPIYDINEFFTELPSKNSFLEFIKQNWYWISILVALLISLGIFLIRKNKKVEEPLSLRESTLLQIDHLEKSKAYEIDLKEYYFDLSIILRRFFASYYHIKVLDKTTSEIEAVLAERGLDKEVIILTRQLLMQSDMVKFAQSVPAIAEIQNVTNDARHVVKEITGLDQNYE